MLYLAILRLFDEQLKRCDEDQVSHSADTVLRKTIDFKSNCHDAPAWHFMILRNLKIILLSL